MRRLGEFGFVCYIPGNDPVAPDTPIYGLGAVAGAATLPGVQVRVNALAPAPIVLLGNSKPLFESMNDEDSRLAKIR